MTTEDVAALRIRVEQFCDLFDHDLSEGGYLGHAVVKDVADLLRDVLAVLPAAPAPEAGAEGEWTIDEDGSHYETTCQKAFQINDGTPAENGMHFCTYCGRRLVVGVLSRPEGAA